MVSTPHSLLVRLLTTSPETLFALAPSLPRDPHVVVLSEDCTQIQPTEYRADAVVQIGEPLTALIVIEVQRRPDEDKRWSWPVYLSTVSARHRMPATLVVIATTAATARWAAGPFPMGNAAELKPVVVGPHDIIDAADQEAIATNPELAVAAMLAYTELRRNPPDSLGLRALLSVHDRTSALADDDRAFYIKIVTAALSAGLRKELENEMNEQTYPPYTKLARMILEGEDKAKAQGLKQGIEQGAEKQLTAQKTLLRSLLSDRELSLSDSHDARIETCGDPSTLDAWLLRVLRVDSVDELLNE